ncbi:MAG: thioredoxin domain-containing protein [Verrucomicrobiota bacterium]|nr:thioredoxin domain-containing protein [Verrucomicrobiota bacterium]
MKAVPMIYVFVAVLSVSALAEESHKDKPMHSFTNRLAQEKSPYLLQHAHNPVDWYPWGDEAFERAVKEDKPIFLSIGYATCHWCHVMEHESFENEEIANLMNEHFVCIKVDREERPDIDNIYMAVCQMMTGSGGWPLTIFMTPDKKPFHAATYVPPDQRYGRIGMKQLIPRVSNAWKTQREKVLESAGQITDVLANQQGAGSGEVLGAELLEHGFEELLSQYDPHKGGFGLQPKFPMPHRLVFMLRRGEAEAIKAVEHTLEEMRKGGIFDQVGFGFHRYSTDNDWLVPHFEKMLYDQALLAIAYTEAYELTGRPFYRQVTEEILEYVTRDMTTPGGGFYSAEDADSEGEEGLFYIWDTKEMESILGDEASFVSKVWNILASGNFRDESTRQMNGKNIPHLSELPCAEDAARIYSPRKKLFEVREKRIHPLKDTKVLADWNGLMIAAFAKAGRAFGEERYVQAAIQANAFIEAEMQRDNGELWHRWREGHKAVPGQLEDYAFMIFGLLELYESTLDFQYLETALKYNDILAASFVDKANGGYFMTAVDAEPLIVRPKELYDGAIPSGNSVHMYNLLKLARLTGRPELEDQAVETGKAFGDAINRSPSNFSQALIALQFAVGDSVEIVVVGDPDSMETKEMLKHINSIYKPGKVVLFKNPTVAEKLAGLAPFTKEQGMVDGETTVYICRNFACEKPINSIDELRERLR